MIISKNVYVENVLLMQSKTAKIMFIMKSARSVVKNLI